MKDAAGYLLFVLGVALGLAAIVFLRVSIRRYRIFKTRLERES